MATAYELVDVSTQLPELIRRPGLTSWRPTNAKAATKTYQTFEQYIATLSDTQKSESKMTEGHWPPPNVQQLHLEHWSVIFFAIRAICLTLLYSMRIYPHLQNTGGFFVAVLQKVEQKTISRDHMYVMYIFQPDPMC
jgi:multisite-specific tRNA:(cytosine-C5)-methyltransferase